MRNRQIELELWTQIGISWVNGPVVARMGRVNQIQDAKSASDINVARYYKRLDKELGQSDYVAGSRFTIADITLLTAVDFATALVDLKPDTGLQNLWQWHKKVSERPSVTD
jgi:glutathione S-transferase